MFAGPFTLQGFCFKGKGGKGRLPQRLGDKAGVEHLEKRPEGHLMQRGFWEMKSTHLEVAKVEKDSDLMNKVITWIWGNAASVCDDYLNI